MEVSSLSMESACAHVHAHTERRKRTFDKESNNKVTYSVIKHKSDKKITTETRVVHPQWMRNLSEDTWLE